MCTERERLPGVGPRAGGCNRVPVAARGPPPQGPDGDKEEEEGRVEDNVPPVVKGRGEAQVQRVDAVRHAEGDGEKGGKLQVTYKNDGAAVLLTL